MTYILVVIATVILALSHLALGKKEIAKFEASAHLRYVSELEVLRGGVEQYIVQNSYVINHAGKQTLYGATVNVDGWSIFNPSEQRFSPQIDEIVLAGGERMQNYSYVNYQNPNLVNDPTYSHIVGTPVENISLSVTKLEVEKTRLQVGKLDPKNQTYLTVANQFGWCAAGFDDAGPVCFKPADPRNVYYECYFSSGKVSNGDPTKQNSCDKLGDTATPDWGTVLKSGGAPSTQLLDLPLQIRNSRTNGWIPEAVWQKRATSPGATSALDDSVKRHRIVSITQAPAGTVYLTPYKKDSFGKRIMPPQLDTDNTYKTLPIQGWTAASLPAAIDHRQDGDIMASDIVGNDVVDRYLIEITGGVFNPTEPTIAELKALHYLPPHFPLTDRYRIKLIPNKVIQQGNDASPSMVGYIYSTAPIAPYAGATDTNWTTADKLMQAFSGDAAISQSDRQAGLGPSDGCSSAAVGCIIHGWSGAWKTVGMDATGNVVKDATGNPLEVAGIFLQGASGAPLITQPGRIVLRVGAGSLRWNDSGIQTRDGSQAFTTTASLNFQGSYSVLNPDRIESPKITTGIFLSTGDLKITKANITKLTHSHTATGAPTDIQANTTISGQVTSNTITVAPETGFKATIKNLAISATATLTNTYLKVRDSIAGVFSGDGKEVQNLACTNVLGTTYSTEAHSCGSSPTPVAIPIPRCIDGTPATNNCACPDGRQRTIDGCPIFIIDPTEKVCEPPTQRNILTRKCETPFSFGTCPPPRINVSYSGTPVCVCPLTPNGQAQLFNESANTCTACLPPNIELNGVCIKPPCLDNEPGCSPVCIPPEVAQIVNAKIYCILPVTAPVKCRPKTLIPNGLFEFVDSVDLIVPGYVYEIPATVNVNGGDTAEVVLLPSRVFQSTEPLHIPFEDTPIGILKFIQFILDKGNARLQQLCLADGSIYATYDQ